MQLWDLSSRSLITRLELDHEGAVSSVACTVVDGTPIAVTTGNDHTVRRWELPSGTPAGPPLHGHSGPVWAVACAHLDGIPFAVTSGHDDTVRFWNLRTGRAEDLLAVPSPRSIALSTTGDLLVATGNDVAVFNRLHQPSPH
jgi:WD40 repeat protein